MFVFYVRPVVVLNAAFCMTCSLLMVVEDVLQSILMFLLLIVVLIGGWSDENVCCVIHDVRLYIVLNNVVISGRDVCCSNL